MRLPKTITLTIDTAGAAFDDHEGGEVARILRHAARELGALAFVPEVTDGRLRDINGNTCGRYSIKAQR